jgi:DUF971 family protein
VNSKGTQAWPIELVVKRKDRLLVARFDDGACFEIACELLRVESPSAQVQGHSAAQKQIVTGKADVSITRMEPVGRYGVRIVFDDGHDSGLFTWDWLYRLGRDQERLMATYRDQIKEMTRTPHT